ncbi:YggS family pyridoxal phosphate-dependent enzyme [bacterium]|nr:YggS family pyridoxal phosphate-dependent enzyme [bacterium]
MVRTLPDGETSLNLIDISRNIATLRQRIRAACERAGRRAEDVRCVAVSKGQAAESIRLAVQAGMTDIGENRVQEAVKKSGELRDLGIRWHLVGSLQTNKVRQALKLFTMIQSLDGRDLATALQAECEKQDRSVDVLLQVEPTGESSKHGVKPEQIEDCLNWIQPFDRLRLRGLMAIGPNTDDPAAIRACFREMARLFRQIRKEGRGGEKFDMLSMGMSSDYELAIEEGATLVRVGTAIFGPRPPAP